MIIIYKYLLCGKTIELPYMDYIKTWMNGIEFKNDELIKYVNYPIKTKVY